MHRKLMALFLVFFLTPPAFAGENLFNSPAAIREEASLLGHEALDVLRAPFDTKNDGLFWTLVVAGGTGMTYVFDNDIRKPFRENRSQTFDRMADLGYAIGNPLVHIGLAGAVYGGGLFTGSQKAQETGKMLGEAAILADAATLVLKQSIGRARPDVNGDKGRFKPLQFASDYDSLPSMHVASSFAVASVMSGTSESLWMKSVYYLTATFVGFSRMYEDKHWASDALVGAAIGELCGRVVTWHHRTGKRKFSLIPMVTGNAASLALSATW